MMANGAGCCSIGNENKVRTALPEKHPQEDERAGPLLKRMKAALAKTTANDPYWHLQRSAQLIDAARA